MEFTPRDIGAYQGSAADHHRHADRRPRSPVRLRGLADGAIHKLAVASGREVRAGGWPVSVTREATHEKIASPLNITGGSVVVVTDGYIGDAPPYQGHVVMIDRSSGRISSVWNSLCSDRHGLIVPRTCPASDSGDLGSQCRRDRARHGRILVATGNAPFNGSTDWGDSVLELSPDGTQLLHNWTPTNQAQLNSSDADLGSTSPAILPTYHGRRLAVQGGKAGVLDLLDLDRLDGTAGGASAPLGRTDPARSRARARPGVHRAGGLVTRWAIWVFVGDGAGRGPTC